MLVPIGYGTVVTRASVGDDIYVFPVNPDEIKKKEAVLTAEALGLLNPNNSNLGGNSERQDGSE